VQTDGRPRPSLGTVIDVENPRKVADERATGRARSSWEEAQGGQGGAKLATARSATDSLAEQGLEVEVSGKKREERQGWQRPGREARGGSENNGKGAGGRGDTVRLRGRGVLRGVVHSGERPLRSRWLRPTSREGRETR